MVAILKQHDERWRLYLIGVKRGKLENTPERANIWYWARHFGQFFGSSPFLKWDSEGCMMFEFWSSSEGLILRTCEQVCEELGLELQIE